MISIVFFIDNFIFSDVMNEIILELDAIKTETQQMVSVMVLILDGNSEHVAHA